MLLGNGDGTFGVPIPLATAGQASTDVKIADLNGDGKNDLVVTTDAGVSVLLGNGDGTFLPAQNFATAPATSLAIADLNKDGRLDLVVTSGDTQAASGAHTVSILLGNGDGTFGAVTSYPTLTPTGLLNPGSVAIGDLNGDGNLDLAIANKGEAVLADFFVSIQDGVAVLLGNGDGTFQPATTVATGNRDGTGTVAIADLNGDGKPDLAVTNSYTNTLWVLTGKGDGTFAAPITFATAAGPEPDFKDNTPKDFVAVGDLDGAGGPDIAVANGGLPPLDRAVPFQFLKDGSVSVLLNVGSNASILHSSVAITVPADLAVTMIGGFTAVPGTVDTYTITVSNNGPSTVSSLTLTDTTSPSAVLLNPTFGTPSAGSYNAATGVWSGLSLASGQNVNITLTGTVDPNATGSAFINTVTVAPPAGTTDTNPINNRFGFTTLLLPEADLAVTVTDGTTTAVRGTMDTYTIVVSNAGPSTATNVTLTDTIPAALLNPVSSSQDFVSVAPGVFNLASLASGATAALTISGTIDPNATGSLTNTIRVTAGTTDPNPGNNAATDTDTLALPADLKVTITDAATTLVPGTVDTYTITVTNNGPSTVGSLTLTDAIPDDLLNATFGSPSAGSYNSGSGLWSGLSLASGQSVFITLSGVIGIATGTLTNTITVTPPAGLVDTNPGNNVATDTDTLVLFSSPYPPPPPATSANMILRRADGLYAIYDIGNNATLAAHPLAQVGTDWQFAGFNGGDTSDMMLRNSTSGAFQVYDVGNNNITGTAALGAVGLNWQVAGFGNFSSRGETDMMLRDANTGGFQAYDIANNQITGTAFVGTVGLDWQVGGFGNFSSRADASDMILRNTTTGGLQVYNIDSNQITGTAFMGTVGLEWQFSGVGNFSSMPGETDVVMRNTTTGGLQVYDIANNQIAGTAFLGTVGLEWQFAGVAPVRGPGTSDLVLRNVNTGAFEAYDIANNQIVGAASLGRVGLEWQVGGFAADPPIASMGGSSQVGQLVQAMAGFGGSSGASDSLNTAPLSTETSQQPLLTTPQHT